MKDGFGRASLKSLSAHHFVLARDPFSLRIRRKHLENHPPPHVTAFSDVTNPKTKMQEMTVPWPSSPAIL